MLVGFILANLIDGGLDHLARMHFCGPQGLEQVFVVALNHQLRSFFLAAVHVDETLGNLALNGHQIFAVVHVGALKVKSSLLGVLTL